MLRKTSLLTYLLILPVLLLTGCSFLRPLPQAALPNSHTEKQKLRDYYFYEAIRQSETGNYAEALESLLLSSWLEPSDAALHYEIGTVFALLGLKKDAAEHLEQAASIQPANRWYLLRLISLYSSSELWDEAIRHALKLQQQHPNYKDIYPILAGLYIQKGERNKAIEAYNKLENFTGLNEELSLEKFQLYLEMGREKEALAEIDRLMKKYLGESRFRVLLGRAYMQMGRKQEAFEEFQRVLTEDPENPYVYLSLSEYYDQEKNEAKSLEAIEAALKSRILDTETKTGILGRYISASIQDSTKHQGAESLLKLLIEQHPLEEQVYVYYAGFLQYQQRDAEFVETLETMLNINPKNEQTWIEMIRHYLSRNNYEAVIHSCDQALEKLPLSGRCYFFRGLALYQQQNYNEAIANYEKGITVLGDQEEKELKSDLYAQMADSYLKLEDKNKAFEMYENALSTNPSNLYVMNNYAYYLSLEKQDLKKAERMSAKTIEKEPDNSTFLDTYAWIFFQQGNYSLAKFYIERALRNHKNQKENPAVLLDHYGDILWMLHEDAKAKENWQKSYESGEKTEVLKNKIERGGPERKN